MTDNETGNKLKLSFKVSWLEGSSFEILIYEAMYDDHRQRNSGVATELHDTESQSHF